MDTGRVECFLPFSGLSATGRACESTSESIPPLECFQKQGYGRTREKERVAG